MTQHNTATHAQTHSDLQALTTRQVRDLLGITDASLRRWVKSGVLPSFKLGGRVFIPRAALMELMQPRVPAPSKRPVLSTAEAWDADHPRP